MKSTSSANNVVRLRILALCLVAMAMAGIEFKVFGSLASKLRQDYAIAGGIPHSGMGISELMETAR